MYQIECSSFKTESFRNGDSETWNNRIKLCDMMADTITSTTEINGNDCKDLLYALSSHGSAFSASSERIRAVSKILDQNGFLPESLTLYNK